MTERKNIIKKIIIFIVAFFMLFGFFLYRTVSQHQKEEITASETSISFKYTEYIDFIDQDNINILKQEIEHYLYKELDYTKKEVDKVSFQSKLYKKDSKIYFFFLLNDGYDTLYGTYYNQKKKSFGDFIWYGDNLNEDYKDDSTSYSYLEIVDENRYKENQLNEKTENAPPDNNDGYYEY